MFVKRGRFALYNSLLWRNFELRIDLIWCIKEDNFRNEQQKIVHGVMKS